MNLLKKIAVGVSTVALPASMFFGTAAVTKAATAGGVYSTPDGTVWFVTKDMQKRPFTSAGAFLSYGFLNFSQVMPADASVTALPTGSFIAPADGKIFCATETKGTDVAGECALITGSKKASFTSAAVFAAQGHSFARAMYGDSSFLEKTSNISDGSAAHLPGVLVNNGGTVQMVVSGGLWGIPSIDVFNSWGYNFADVVPANAADTAKSQVGVIPARMAGELVPTGTTGGGDTTADCNNLEGDTGAITTAALSDYSGEEVGEGESEVPIMSFEVEADNDSDVAITSVKVELDENGSGSTDLEDYASEVTVLLDGDVVGSADVDDFTESSTAGTWTKTISLDCAAVDADETGEFTIAIDGNDVIDSNDLNQAWLVDVTSIRFEDGDGVVTTENSDADSGFFPDLQKTFTWQSFANANDIELNASLSDDAEDINEAHVIDIDDADDTDNVDILAFTLENKGDVDVTVNDLPVVIATTEAAGTNFDDPAEVINKVTLWVDGDQISSDSLTETDGNDSETALFDDIDLDIDAGDSVDFVVAVDLQDTASVLDNGDTVSATLTVGSIDADDSEGDTVVGGDLTGSAAGDAHAVYDSGIMVEFVSATSVRTFTADAAGEDDQGEFKVTFDVTAFDGDMRIDKSSEVAGADAAGQGVEFAVTSSAGTPVLGSNILESSSTDTEDTANTFEVDEDTTRTFTLTVIYSADSTPTDGSHYVSISSINWGTATNDTNANYYTFNLGDYKTPYLFLNGM